MDGRPEFRRRRCALMADGRLDPTPLVTHRFDIADAGAGLRRRVGLGAKPGNRAPVSRRGRRRTGVAQRSVVLRADEPPPGQGVVGWIGSGNFASRVLIPAFAKAGAAMHTLASSGGVSAAVVGKREGFRRATTDADTLLGERADRHDRGDDAT